MKFFQFILIICLIITLNIVNADSSSENSTSNNEASIECSNEMNNTLSSSMDSTSASLDSSSLNNNNNNTYTNYTCTENESCRSEIEVCLKTYGSESKDKSDNCNCNGDCECHKKNNSTSSSSTSNKTNHNCVPRDSLKIKLLPTLVNSWTDGGKGNFTQFDITIQNGGKRNIKQIYIGYDKSLSLRDDTSLWNMVISDSKENILILPQYQQSINSMSNYTFGYIKSGNNPADLIINEIVLE
ncbi:hypothetical protein ACTFIU_009535 [Dictyostelium citrinum]